MSFADDKNGDRRRKPHPGVPGEDFSSQKRRLRRTQSPEVGTALRTVYQRTIDEAIPADLLDLLGKLD